MTLPAVNVTSGLIELAGLHASMADLSLDSINFLNEVMDRYPHAISFAPGAPYGGFLQEIDVQACLDRYCEYLKREKNLPDAAILHKLFQYGPSQGLINDLIAAALSRDFDIHVSAEAVVVTVGCQEAMLLALRALCASPVSAFVRSMLRRIVPILPAACSVGPRGFACSRWPSTKTLSCWRTMHTRSPCPPMPRSRV